MCNIVSIYARCPTLLTLNMKKDKHFSFRTTQDDWEYIVQLAKNDERTPSFILNKMIQAFRNRGVFDSRQIN